MAELTKYDVEQWIRYTATGEFHYTKVLEGEVLKSAYPKLRKIMYDLCHPVDPVKNPPCVETIGRNDGRYRPIEEMPPVEDWQGLDTSKDFPLILPLDLRKYVWIDTNSLIIFAGSKDSCKTGLLMRTVALNMPLMHVEFLTNMEGGPTQMKRRFDAMDIEIPYPAPFGTRHIIDNFHDAIQFPDTLYVIDYIDVPESGEFYMIGASLAKIQAKLVNSVAIVGLQKRTGSDTAYGGEQTLKKATLYLALDSMGKNTSKIKIVSAKRPANPKIIPKNMMWTFDYSGEGTNFDNIQPYYGE